MKAIDIKKCIDKAFPESIACEWDNVGLLVGRADKEVKKLLVTLDVDLSVAKEAVSLGCDAIVSHHPVIFHKLRSVTDQDPIGKMIINLLKNDITVISAHTNLDKAADGLNDYLAHKLGIENCKILEPEGDSVHGFGRIGELPCAVSFGQFIENCSRALGVKGLRYTGDTNKTVRRIAVNSGGGADALYEAVRKGADVFVTGDVKYNPFRDASELGIALVDAGHYETEFIVTELFCELFKENLPDTEVFVSKANTSIIEYFMNQE